MNKCKREQLFGHWFRQEVDDLGVEHSEYATFNEDGSFEFTFIAAQQGNVIEQTTEYGDWGLVADIHFTITQGELVGDTYYDADLTNNDNYQAYKVLKLNRHYFEYQHLLTQEVYLLKRTTSASSLNQ